MDLNTFNTIYLYLIQNMNTSQSLKEGFYDYYMRLFGHYKNIYGDKIAVFVQNGSFYECYGMETEDTKEGNLTEVLDIINLKMGNCTHKSGAFMGGFQPAYLEKYGPVLLDHGYTVIIAEQKGKDPATNCFLRDVTKILSPSTYLDDFTLTNSKKQKNKVLLTAYFEFNKKNHLIMISMASIDLSIGHNVVYHCSNSKQFDKEKCMDECYRFLHSQNPIEFIIYIDHEQYRPFLIEKIKDLSIDSLGCTYFIKIVPQEVHKITYQEEFLSTIFPERGFLDPIQYLELTKYPSLVISYVLLLRFAYDHDETIIQNIQNPIFWDDSNFLILENNAIYQLNIVKTHTINTSLIDITDYTSTSMGRRLHKERLLNPILNKDLLENRYNQIEWMMDRVEVFEPYLKKILDIERIHRKIENGTLDPCDFLSLERSYEQIERVMEIVRENMKNNIFSFWKEDLLDRFKEWRQEYSSIINLKDCNYKTDSIRGKIFCSGISEELDRIQYEMMGYMKEMNEIQSLLSGIIKSNSLTISKTKKKREEEDSEDEMLIRLENTDRDGYFFVTTKKRADLIQKYAEAVLNEKGWKHLKYTTQSSTVKITCDRFYILNTNLETLQLDLQKCSKSLFLQKVKDLYNKYKAIFRYIVDFIGEMDWMKSAAKCAKLHFYCKPTIMNKTDKSYVVANDLRHAMIEHLLKDTQIRYVPNNIELGLENNNGILLFGTNSSGKSSLMKSLGIAIIMAQSGLYVPCSNFMYYPYKNILTRITGDDNFSKGHSSFVVEMTELNTILNRSDHNSLILGDEICHGTEQYSALSIVSSSIIELSKKYANFIFATHLHQLSKMEEITGLPNVHCKHLKVLYDEKSENLIYDRKLDEGAGSDLYGLEVAKYIIREQPEFIQRCLKTRRKLLDIPSEVISNRTSKYNAKLVVDKCKVCGKRAEDTHHIHFQCNADEDGAIEASNTKFHKNVKSNLVTLCKRCHINVHHSIDGKILEIRGYKQSTSGTVLDFDYREI